MGVKFLNIENGTSGRLWRGDVFGLWGSRRQQVWPRRRVGGASSYGPSFGLPLLWKASIPGVSWGLFITPGKSPAQGIPQPLRKALIPKRLPAMLLFCSCPLSGGIKT